MTMKKAKKVAKRAWSFDKFKDAVVNRAKKQEIAVAKAGPKIKTCYEGGVTVADTVKMLQST
jgi:hypothetical protein